MQAQREIGLARGGDEVQAAGHPVGHQKTAPPVGLQSVQISDRGAGMMNRLVPFIDAVERLLPLPFGQSVVMIGTPQKG